MTDEATKNYSVLITDDDRDYREALRELVEPEGYRTVLASSGEDPEVRVPVRGGPHDVGVAFLRMPPDLVEHVREPFQNPDAPSGTGGGPTGLMPAITTVTIAGPYNPAGPGDTPNRRRIRVHPGSVSVTIFGYCK